MTRSLLAGLLAVGVACSVLAGPVAGQKSKAKSIKKDRYHLGLEEIQERPDLTNAYDAVRLLRPQWLKTARSKGSLGGGAFASTPYRPEATPNPRGADGGAPKQDPNAEAGIANRDAAFAGAGSGKVSAVLYIDDVKQEDIDELRNIRIVEISEIEYMNGTQASGRYGAGHEAGAILLTTTRSIHQP